MHAVVIATAVTQYGPSARSAVASAFIGLHRASTVNTLDIDQTLRGGRIRDARFEGLPSGNLCSQLDASQNAAWWLRSRS